MCRWQEGFQHCMRSIRSALSSSLSQCYIISTSLASWPIQTKLRAAMTVLNVLLCALQRKSTIDQRSKLGLKPTLRLTNTAINSSNSPLSALTDEQLARWLRLKTSARLSSCTCRSATCATASWTRTGYPGISLFTSIKLPVPVKTAINTSSKPSTASYVTGSAS